MLVLNTNKVASDLLDHRGTIYSDRPRLISKSQCPQCLQLSPTIPSLQYSGGRDIHRWLDNVLCTIWQDVRASFFCTRRHLTIVLMT